MIRVLIASDHAGIELKTKILSHLMAQDKTNRFDVKDLGPFSTDSVDYPDFADLVCSHLHGFTLIDLNDDKRTHLTELGILICGSGQGMNIRANRYLHLRAALCWNEEVAQLAREHNDANVLCLGARLIDHDVCLRIVDRFIGTEFLGGRHRGRVAKLSSPLQAK